MVAKKIELEEIRKEVFDHYDITAPEDKTVEQVMQNVYYTNLVEEGFDEQATEVYKHHEEMLVKIMAGELLPKLELHPFTGEKKDFQDPDFVRKVNESVSEAS